MGVMKTASLVVALLALIIGGINTYRPDLWLKIPHVGFIPWVIGGHQLPPYFYYDAWKPETFATWARDGDVVVTSGAKSGTNWLLYTMHLIRTRGTDNPPWVEMMYNVPWPTCKHHPTQTWAEMQELLNTTILPSGTPLKQLWDHPDYPFRVFKAHEMPIRQDDKTPLPAECLPVREFPKVKFIAMIRPSRDVMKSMMTFWGSHTDAFKNVWGGFPPNWSKPEEAVEALSPGGNLYNLWFTYVKTWWEWKREPNVLLLHYDNYKKDPKGTIQRISEFVDYKLTAAEIDKVAELSSFAKMKPIQDKFKIVMWSHPDRVHCMKSEEDGGTLFKSGTSGRGKTFLSPELEDKWSKALESELPDPVMRKWMEEGGSY